jgi:hypothetical protein
MLRPAAALALALLVESVHVLSAQSTSASVTGRVSLQRCRRNRMRRTSHQQRRRQNRTGRSKFDPWRAMVAFGRWTEDGDCEPYNASLTLPAF